MDELRTARSWGVPWTVLRGERPPTGRWSSRDALLAVALTQLEASLCPGCGQPQWLAFDHEVEWDVPGPMRCFPCTTRDQAASAFMKSSRGADGEVHVDAPEALRWPINRVEN